MQVRNIIELDDEIFLKDAYLMAEWLEQERITRFISEGEDISDKIRKSLRYTSCPIVTHLFCNGGNFYMIKHNGRSIGYLKLVDKGNRKAEIVVVIGDRAMWNKGFGTEAVRLAMNECFFRLRYESLMAKIMVGNEGSHHVFQKVGFHYDGEIRGLSIYSMKLDSFLALAA
ncbi:hypothetical protein ABB02_00247 [Clostridiaceae bacterium JG1575]|nr:hypothetical protein ABB02_00247 [Clostridiaceae bacterium JG1575]